MGVKADQERLRTLLKDTITLLCKNGLSFKSKFSVDALIGVTLDEDDVFLVSIRELVKSGPDLPGSEAESDAGSTVSGAGGRNGRRRKRKRTKVKTEGESDTGGSASDDDGGSGNDQSGFEDNMGGSSMYSVSTAEPTTKRANIQVKEEQSEDSANVDDDIVFVKSELDDNWSQRTGDDGNQSSMYGGDGSIMGDQNFGNLSGLDLVPLSQDGSGGGGGEMWSPILASNQQRPYRPRISRAPNMSSPGTSQMNDQQQNPDQQTSPLDSPKVFKCSICSLTTINKYYFRKHSEAHVGKFDFYCKHCGKGCRTKQHLMGHEAEHLGQFLHECDICDRGFRYKHLYKTHMHTVHQLPV